MYQRDEINEKFIAVTSKEKPIFVDENGSEYIKCPHCKALHIYIESENENGVSGIRIIGLKKSTP